MLQASEKEYQVLKREISDLRICITKYTGYIISIFGASILINKIFFEKNLLGSSLSILVLLAVTILIVTLLFDVVWYKFNSHNRYVGYFQLLSQEVSHHDLNRDELFLKDKLYLDLYQDSNKSPNNSKDKNLLTWEYLISRFINAQFHQKKNDLLKATDKVRFVFKIPPPYTYRYLSEGLKVKYDNIDNEFFKKIIYELYGYKEGNYSFRGYFKDLFVSTAQIWNSIKFLYSPIREKTNTVKKINIDSKYLSGGWEFPKKITQIAFILIILLMFMFIFILWNDFQIMNFQKEFQFINLIIINGK
ncbi:MAG TPA: hypothetical protein PL089_15240 [Ignavibacteria bacterium]|nr:hypothetical protein [Ignavibacteria bacterium]